MALTFGVGEEPLTLGSTAEWTLETPSAAAIVLTFRGGDRQAPLLFQGQITVRVGVSTWNREVGRRKVWPWPGKQQESEGEERGQS